MWLIKLAWKNLWRNKTRTFITMAAVFFAVILSVIASSLKEGVFENLVKNIVSFYSGYVQVHKAGYWDEQILDNSMEKSTAVEQKLIQQKNVKGIAARLESFALASSADITKGCLVTGIEPQNENLITSLQQKIIKGQYITDNDNAVLLAQGLAERLQLNINDTIILIAQGFHGSTAAGKYPVKGIVKFGSPDLNDRTLFMPLAAAQDFFSAYGMISTYVLSLSNPDLTEKTASTIRSSTGTDYEVMTWGQMMPDVKQHIEADSNNMKYVQGVLYMLICFGIFGTILMMMVERKFEMGMLVAVGMKKGKLMFLLLFESILTVLTGCIGGIIASIPLVILLNRHPFRMGGETAKAYERFGFEAIFPTSTDASNFIQQGLVVLVMGLVLSLYPMYRVWRLNAVTAMKR